MRKKVAATMIALLAATGAGATAAPWEDDDSYDVWDPIYTTPPTTSASTPGKATITEVAPPAATDFSILGLPRIDAQSLCSFVRRHNPDFQLEIAETFVRLGEVYGIRGDVALCQAIIETGWFKFADGTAVRPEQHNYCGLGVTGRGMTGHAFDTVEDGVRAHLQHLYAYACTQPLPKDEPLTDPRFSLVRRGVATTWTDLSNRWAMNPNYGVQIMNLYNQLLEHCTAHR